MIMGRTKRPQAALTILSRLHGRSVSPDEVRQHCKGNVFDVAQMVNCGRSLGMKLRAHKSDWTDLPRLSLPAIGVLRTGGFLLLGQIVQERVVAADLTSRRPEYLSREELENIWDGRVVELAARRSWTGLGRAWLAAVFN